MKIARQLIDDDGWTFGRPSVPIRSHGPRSNRDLIGPFISTDVAHGRGNVPQFPVHVAGRPFIPNDAIRDAVKPRYYRGGSWISVIGHCHSFLVLPFPRQDGDPSIAHGRQETLPANDVNHTVADHPGMLSFGDQELDRIVASSAPTAFKAVLGQLVRPIAGTDAMERALGLADDVIAAAGRVEIVLDAFDVNANEIFRAAIRRGVAAHVYAQASLQVFVMFTHDRFPP
jgi:hypothetical protein